MNGVRGEVSFRFAGRAARLCLTLGALAEMESGLGVTSLAALAERLKAPSARDIAVVLGALLKGGDASLSTDDLIREPIDLGEAVAAIAAAFEASGLAR